MTYEKLNIRYRQSVLAGIVLYQSWTVTTHKRIRILIGRFFFIKISIFFILKAHYKTEHFKSKLTNDRSHWLPNKL